MEFLTENSQIIMITLAALVLVVIGSAGWRALSPRIAGRRGQRLGISEYYELDKSRRLVLVRRDNLEHLILIGGAQDVVIETAIMPNAFTSAYTPTPVTPDQPAFRPSPRAPVFSDRKAAPARAGEPLQTPPRREEPEL